MIADILPQCRNKYRGQRHLLVAKPDSGQAFKTHGPQRDIENTVVRIVDLQPQLTDNDGGNQNRHEVNREEYPLAFDLFPQRQCKSQRQRQLKNHRKQSQQKGIAQRLHKADCIAREKLLVILESQKCLWPHSVPFKKAVIERGAERCDQDAAEKNQRRQQEDQDMKLITVYFLHNNLPFTKGDSLPGSLDSPGRPLFFI